MALKRILIIFGIILFFIMVVFFSFFIYRLVRVDLAGIPGIQFLDPNNEEKLPLDDTLVRFIARDKNGIEHVELWVDGELYAARKSELQEGSNPFPFVEQWLPQSTGTHTLTARAFNTNNRASVVSIVVQVSERMIAEETGAEQELEEHPTDEGTPSALSSESGHESESLEAEGVEPEISLVDEGISIPPLEGFLSEPERSALDMIPGIRLPGERIFREAILLEVEALYLETNSGWNGLSCYLSLPGFVPELIPDPRESDSISAGPENYWDILSLAGRENSRIVYLDMDALTLDIELECNGHSIIPGEYAAVYSLGTYSANHPSSDWGGRELEGYAESSDGWFRVGYRINRPITPEIDMPAPNLILDCASIGFIDVNACYLRWNYPDDAREVIDGFVIELNGAYFSKEYTYKDSHVIASAWGTYPSCGETIAYQIYAYQGDPLLGTKSPRSNEVRITAPPCFNYAFVRFEYINPIRLTGDDYSIDVPPPFVTSELDTGGTGREEGDVDKLSVSDDPPDWESYSQGCSFSDLWANDQKIDVGSSDSDDCFHWTTETAYRVIELDGVETDTIVEPLDEFESLHIGMFVYDDDAINDDKQCYGEYVHYPPDLGRIANLPGGMETYTRYFCESGGGCCILQYSIELIHNP